MMDILDNPVLSAAAILLLIALFVFPGVIWTAVIESMHKSNRSKSVKFKRDPVTGLNVANTDKGEFFYNPKTGLLIQATPNHEMLKHGQVASLEEAVAKAKLILGDDND